MKSIHNPNHPDATPPRLGRPASPTIPRCETDASSAAPLPATRLPAARRRVVAACIRPDSLGLLAPAVPAPLRADLRRRLFADFADDDGGIADTGDTPPPIDPADPLPPAVGAYVHLLDALAHAIDDFARAVERQHGAAESRERAVAVAAAALALRGAAAEAHRQHLKNHRRAV